MSSTYGRPTLWLVLGLAVAMVLCAFRVAGFSPSQQRAPLKESPTSRAPRHTWARSVSAAAPPAKTDLRVPDPAPQPARSPSLDQNDDDEIALFDNNLARLNHSEHLFKIEQAQHLFDERATECLSAELMELSAGFPFPAHAHVLCTASICEVQWQSTEALETLIPELVPWLLTQNSYAVAESAEAKVDIDVTKALRLLLPNRPTLTCRSRMPTDLD